MYLLAFVIFNKQLSNNLFCHLEVQYKRMPFFKYFIKSFFLHFIGFIHFGCIHFHLININLFTGSIFTDSVHGN